MTFDDPIDGTYAQMRWRNYLGWKCLTATHWRSREHIAAVRIADGGARIEVFAPVADGRGGLATVYSEGVDSTDENEIIMRVIVQLVALRLVDPLWILMRAQ